MVSMKRPQSSWVLAVVAVAGMAVFAAPRPAAAENAVENFRLVFEAYERELKGRHYAAAIPYAEQALTMARKSGAFGDDFIHTLTANLGKMYFLVGRWAEAERVFSEYLAARRHPGDSLDEFLTVLLQAGTARRELGRPRRARRLFERALEYLPRRDRERRPVRADALNQLTLVLVELKQADTALETGEEAWELYEDLYGRKDVRTLEAGLTLARIEVVLLKNGRADGHLERISESLKENAGLRDWQKCGLHNRIAALYERMEEKDDAERHRKLAGEFLRGIGDVELELRKSDPPEYPRRAMDSGTEGVVVVEYTVEKDGDVDDIRIVRSSPRGVFDKAVMEAVKKWRYKPPRKNGERIDFPGVRKEVMFKVPE
ncbi:MAG: TonB family protein [Alphaproteobacteria bacterium]